MLVPSCKPAGHPMPLQIFDSLQLTEKPQQALVCSTPPCASSFELCKHSKPASHSDHLQILWFCWMQLISQSQSRHPPVHCVALPLPAAELSSQAQQVFVSSMEAAHRLETDPYLMQSMGQLVINICVSSALHLCCPHLTSSSSSSSSEISERYPVKTSLLFDGGS